jgi:glucan biosynthesis protein C
LYYWPLPALVKFLLILILIIPIMLVSYKLFVRNTIIGRILNGKNPSRIPEKHR